MSSTNGSGRPTGSISIPVEIIRDSNSNNSNNHSRHNSPFTGFHNDTSYGGFSDSPPWNSSMNTSSNGRFLPRSSPNSAYDRVINNSQFNQPFFDRSSYQTYQEPQYRQPQQRMYEPGPSHFSRSNEDLLSSPFDSVRYSTQPQYTSLIPPSFGSGGGSGGYRPDSDFVQSSKYSSPLRRSFDALNDFPDTYQNFSTMRQPTSSSQQQQQQPHYRTTYQTQHQPQQQQQQQQQQQHPVYTNPTYINPNIVYTDEYGAPTNHYQPNTFQEPNHFSNDRARSPASQRGPSPARTSPPSQNQQQQSTIPDEPELKMAKDSDGPIPMPAPASASAASPSTTDQQVPITDTATTIGANASTPPASDPVRDPNVIALEKLEQIKQSLGELEQQVDAFNGSTRNDRHYKALDEQALKIMIRCDELVDVSADIKEKRKEMIRNVERVIGKLESKVPLTPAPNKNSNPMEISTISNETTNTIDSIPNDLNEQLGSPKKSSPSTSPPKETIISSAIEQPIST